MIRSRRLALLLLPAALELFLVVLPGRAQEEQATRYMFADTTLLRDTLGLKFGGLYPLVDSLAALGQTVTADTIRALSVRYRLPLDSLVALAQSQDIPVDSVGSYLERERRSPLGRAASRSTALRYSSSYNVQRTSSTWMNSGDFRYLSGPLFLQNTTTIVMDRYESGANASQRQTRTSGTEGGWRFTPNYSIGARANLDRFDSHDPGSTDNQGESKNEYQLSVRTRQQRGRGLRSEVNFFTGLIDLNNYQQVKRGTSADLNGTLRVQTRLFTHDLSGQVNGNVAQTRVPTALQSTRTKDLSNNLRGTLGLLPGRALGFNLNYAFRRIRVETPTDTGTVRQVRTNNSSTDATVRLRLNNDRYVNMTGRYAYQEQEQGGTLNSQSNRRDLGLGVDGRYLFKGWNLEGRFGLTYSRSEYPTRAVTEGVLGGYGESLRVATIDGTLTRSVGRKIVLRATGGVSLYSYRYFIINQYPNPPVNRDQYRQGYHLEAQYNSSKRFNTGVGMDVGRSQLVNLKAGSTSSNNEVDTYRAEWRWSFIMMTGLTASQSNTITADYTYYDYLPKNDKLQMDYNSATTLNAVISPRFTVDIRHNSRHQPSGSYTEFPDGIYYLGRSEVNDNYTLSARLTYSPSAALSLFMQPDYLAGERDASQSGELTPARSTRQLNFSGGASLNLPLGPKGRLSGDIVRTYRGDRSTEYTNGVPQWPPHSEIDFWNGSLQVSWEL